MILLNNHSVKINKTQKASAFLKEQGHSLKDEEITINGTRIAAESCNRYFLRADKDTVIEIKSKKE